MSVVAAYLMPHPPLAVPSVGRGGEKNIANTLSAFDEAAREIEKLVPEVIVFITPHNVIYADYFHISPGDKASGNLAHFNAPQEKFEVSYDTGLARKIALLAEENAMRAGTLGERDAALDHGVTVPMWFINRRYARYKAVRVCQSGFDALEHYKLGKIIAGAVEETGQRAVIIASGDLSHKMSQASSYGFAPEGPAFDARIKNVMETGDFGALLATPAPMREAAAECGYNSITMLAGCFDGCGVESRLLSYEGPFGVGYAVAEVKPGARDKSRSYYEQAVMHMLNAAGEQKKTEDAYRSLARQSLECYVTHNAVLPMPKDLPGEMLNNKAGAFVSLSKNGMLRGCVGTIAPTCSNIAGEIIQNAISAGAFDNRFEPVEVSELPLLVYKVDILAAPEKISGLDELDVKRYGVIVTSGSKRGLLLPNLDGIKTVEQQVAVARQKGNIDENEAVVLERFEVTRHE